MNSFPVRNRCKPSESENSSTHYYNPADQLSSSSEHNAAAAKKIGVCGENRGMCGENLKFSGEKLKFAGEKKTIHNYADAASEAHCHCGRLHMLTVSD
jgi:hypothetical protein